MKLKISEDEYGKPTVEYKSKESYFRCMDIIDEEYLNKIPCDIYINLINAFQDVEYEGRKGFSGIYDSRVIIPKATKLYYNKLTYSIDELIDDMASIIDDYSNYNVSYVGFDGIRQPDNDGSLIHIGLEHTIYEPYDPKYYNSLIEVLNDLKDVSRHWNDTKVSRLYIELY